MKDKKVVRGVLLGVSIFLNIWGIFSLLYASSILKLGIVCYLGNFRLLVQYIFVVATMAPGILLFGVFSGMLEGKQKTIWATVNCVYSTLLTIPLFLTFALSFFVMDGKEIPMVTEIALEFIDIFKNKGTQYFIFSAGTLMGIVFLAVPIITTISTIKKK